MLTPCQMSDELPDDLLDDLLTVAEAARRMRIDPKQVRRYAGKLRTQDRTPTGHVPLRVRLSALIALRDAPIHDGGSQKDTGQDIGQDRDRTPGRTRQDTPREEAEGAPTGETVQAVLGTVPAALYQHRITDLEAQNAELKADKERLYGLLETAQANLSREQALRSLPPPEQALSAPTVVGGSKEAGSWARVKKWFSNM